ncbi:uncharacterized protein [Ptychodera flava]|uniref:uncharacterized protein n=1 Tax=Ptychodera flava TaxID=63121 RepID=UPI003969F36C
METDIFDRLETQSPIHSKQFHIKRKQVVLICVTLVTCSILSMVAAICLLILDFHLMGVLAWISSALYEDLMVVVVSVSTKRRSQRCIKTSLLLSRLYIPLSIILFILIIFDIYTSFNLISMFAYVIKSALCGAVMMYYRLITKDKVYESWNPLQGLEDEILECESTHGNAMEPLSQGLEIRDDHITMADNYIYL